MTATGPRRGEGRASDELEGGIPLYPSGRRDTGEVFILKGYVETSLGQICFRHTGSGELVVLPARSLGGRLDCTIR